MQIHIEFNCSRCRSPIMYHAIIETIVRALTSGSTGQAFLSNDAS